MNKTLCHKHTQTPAIIMQQLIGDYLAGLQMRQFSVKSVDLYRRVLEDFLAYLAGLGRERAQDITAEDLEAYRLALVQRNFAPSSLEVYLRTVRQFFGWLEQQQKLFVNPASGLLIPQPPRKLLSAPSEEEMKKLLAQPDASTPCGIRDRAWMETAYATGARREELIRLTIFDPDLDNQRLRVLGKGKKERVLPLGQHATQWLKRYLTDARPKLIKGNPDELALWLNLLGKPLDYGALQQILRRHSLAAGFAKPTSAHALRRACATHMLRHGAHPLQLQLLLGHASLGTLGQYLRLTITELQATHRQSNPGS